MSEKLRFCSSVTLDEVNPLNRALRNDYISNLVRLCYAVLPRLEKTTGTDLVVKTGFKSTHDAQFRVLALDEYFCSANAIEIGFENYDLMQMVDYSKKSAHLFKQASVSVLVLESSVIFIQDYKGVPGVYRYDSRPILISEW